MSDDPADFANVVAEFDRSAGVYIEGMLRNRGVEHIADFEPSKAVAFLAELQGACFEIQDERLAEIFWEHRTRFGCVCEESEDMLEAEPIFAGEEEAHAPQAAPSVQDAADRAKMSPREGEEGECLVAVDGSGPSKLMGVGEDTAVEQTLAGLELDDTCSLIDDRESSASTHESPPVQRDNKELAQRLKDIPPIDIPMDAVPAEARAICFKFSGATDSDTLARLLEAGRRVFHMLTEECDLEGAARLYFAVHGKEEPSDDDLSTFGEQMYGELVKKGYLEQAMIIRDRMRIEGHLDE
jgi:hypothetical protein